MAIGLAIAGLVGGKRVIGKLLAIAALILGLVVVVVAGPGFIDAIKQGVKEGTEQGTESSRLEVGDCLIDNALAGLEPGELARTKGPRVVPCSKQHQLEVYAADRVTRRAYPGEVRMRKLAEKFCTGPALRRFVGRSSERAELLVTYYYPEKARWRSGGRQIVCLVSQPDYKTVGSLTGSKAR